MFKRVWSRLSHRGLRSFSCRIKETNGNDHEPMGTLISDQKHESIMVLFLACSHMLRPPVANGVTEGGIEYLNGRCMDGRNHYEGTRDLFSHTYLSQDW